MKINITLAIICLVPMIGCSGDASPQQPEPTLPPPSSIPPGIYSGTIAVNVTIWEDGVREETNDSRPLTIVFDENGRFLDGDGVPFAVGKVYWLDTGNLLFEEFARSLIVIDNGIVLRFDLTVYGDLGTTQIEMTGNQTDTITFDATTGMLTFVRTQGYGGIGSDGAILHFSTEGNAILERG